MSTTLTIECPACATAFPVDPAKVPAGGARTECTVCHTPFRVDDPTGEVAYEASPDPWEDSGADVDDGPTEEVVTVEGVVTVDEVVTVWDADAPPADDAEVIDEEVGGAEAVSDGEEDELAWGAGGGQPDDGASDALDGGSEVYGGDSPEQPAADEGSAEGDDHDLSGQLEGMESAVDETFSEMSEAMDGLVQSEDAAPGEDDGSPVAEGIVTDQWSELVSEETGSSEDSGGFEETADADAWGGSDAEEWVLETEDEEMTLADLDLDVERLDTVEDEVRAAQEEPELSGMADTADAFVTDAGEDLLGGNEVVLPEDALEVEGGIADVGEPEGEPGSAEEVEAVGSEEVSGEVEQGEEVFQFGRRDPHDKARRLARVLVSDMITYNPERHEQALAENRLKDDFEEEIDKSWAEYVEQVGPEIAESTDYWRDALNEILARGEPLF